MCVLTSRCVCQITGQEETLYQATVLVTAKGRKHDLPVKKGDHISIIRTTNCPKGKWLSRDSSNNCEYMSTRTRPLGFQPCAGAVRDADSVSLPDGYVSVEHVELDIKEMLELGKKVANKQKSASSPTEVDSAGKRCVQE